MARAKEREAVRKVVRPPIGVTPRKLWIEIRIRNLSRAVCEYTQAGILEPVDEWTKELRELISVREGLDDDQRPILPFPVMPSQVNEAESLFNSKHPNSNEPEAALYGVSKEEYQKYVNGNWGPSPVETYEKLQQENERLRELCKLSRNVLHDLNIRGGMGYDRHRWVEEAIAAIDKEVSYGQDNPSV
jgi:hypothetical protein